MAFGEIPYKRAWYIDVANTDSEAINLLLQILSNLRQGKPDRLDMLSVLICHSEMNVRLYAQQLFADVCSHNQVYLFGSALEAAKSMDEMQTIILRIGQVLSSVGIPLLLDWMDELEDADIDEYVCHALRDIYPIKAVDHLRMSRAEIRKSYEDILGALDSSLYYYRGKPIFVGNVTKDLIVACTVAYKEKRKAPLLLQPQILSNFSGRKCPVSNGQMIGESDMENLFAYVEGLAGMKWDAGCKYFFHHQIVGDYPFTLKKAVLS